MGDFGSRETSGAGKLGKWESCGDGRIQEMGDLMRCETSGNGTFGKVGDFGRWEACDDWSIPDKENKGAGIFREMVYFR